MTELESRIRILLHVRQTARLRMRVASTIILVGLMTAVVIAIFAATSGVLWLWLAYVALILIVVRAWFSHRSYIKLEDALTAEIHHLKAER